MNMNTARARVRAKKFRSSIPIGLAIKMPDSELDFLDSQDDEYVQAYMACLEEKAQIQMHHKLGILWEKK